MSNCTVSIVPNAVRLSPIHIVFVESLEQRERKWFHNLRHSVFHWIVFIVSIRIAFHNSELPRFMHPLSIRIAINRFSHCSNGERKYDSIQMLFRSRILLPKKQKRVHWSIAFMGFVRCCVVWMTLAKSKNIGALTLPSVFRSTFLRVWNGWKNKTKWIA